MGTGRQGGPLRRKSGRGENPALGEPTGPPPITIASKRVRDAGRGLKLPHGQAGDAPSATATSWIKRAAAGATPAESPAEDMLTLLSVKNYTAGLAQLYSS